MRRQENAPPQPSEHERSNAMLCHLLALAAFVVPLGNIVGPLIVWLAQKGKSEFIDRHGRESLNFQITMTLASAVATLVFLWPVGRMILTAVQNDGALGQDDLPFKDKEDPIVWFVIAVLTFGILSLFDLIMTIVGAVKAHSGQTFRYPFALPLL